MADKARPTNLAAAIAARATRNTEQKSSMPNMDERRRQAGRALNADLRRDATALRENPHYLDEQPTRRAAAQRYLNSGLLDQNTDTTDQED